MGDRQAFAITFVRCCVSFCPFILAALVPSAVQGQGINTTSRIAFDRTEHHFQVIATNEEQTLEFRVVSAGYEPLVIYAIKPEFSCTSVD